MRGERRRDRRPHVGLAVRHAHAFEHLHVAVTQLVEGGQQLVDQAALADAALAEHVQQQAAPLAERQVQCRAGQPQLGVAAHETQVAAALSRTRGRQRVDGQPRADRLLATARLQFGQRAVLDDRPMVSANVASPTSTPPGGASDCSRDAVFTTSPMAV